MSAQLNKGILCACLCGICFQLSAQQYGYFQYNTGSGAPFDQVSTVIQDNEGFLWIGSHNGLYRFDGKNFDIHSLHTKSQYIHQLHEYGDDLLFVNEMSIYQIGNLRSTPRVSMLLEGSINENDELLFYPNDFVPGNDQEVWISQSNHSIGRLRGGDFKTYPFSGSEKAQKLAVHKDSKGGIWALSPLDGLFYFDKSTDSFEKKLNIENGNTLLIHDDYLLVGSDALRVYTIDDSKPKLDKTIALDDDRVTAMHVDQNEQYFIGTQKGKLFRFSNLDRPPETIYGANEAHRVEALDFGHIYEIYVTQDSIGNNHRLWVGSETGLWLLQHRFFRTVENLPMNNPVSIAMGDKGNAWVSMSYLYGISPGKNEFTAQPVYNNLQVNAVAQDVTGHTWVTTTTPRVQLLKYKNDRLLQRYDFHDRGEAIFYLYADSNGNIWFCQAPLNKPIVGVARINAKGEINYYNDEKGFSSRVLAIKESSRGEIYAVGIGENSYLYRYEPGQDRFINVSPELPFTAILNFEAHDLTIDDRGIVWLATTDGLLRYDSEKITLIQNDILGQEEVRGVTHYANNNIWIATATKGLVFYQENNATALGEQEGLPAVISAYRCITTDARGRLWAGTPEGLVYSRISAATLPYSNSPRLRKVTIDKQDLTGNFDQDLRINEGDLLQIEFTNLSFPARNVQYQYRLLSKEDRQVMLEEQLWQSNGNHNTLALDQMEAGDYYLELRARQPGGYQWSKPSELHVNVFQPWYWQSWFIYGLTGLLVLVTAFYFRFYIRRRLAGLQQIVKSSHEQLANKEAQLLQKVQEFEVQQEALANASSNIQTLELFISEIKKDASWDDIITAMGKAVMQSEDINAFEIAFMESGEIIHRGYSDQEKGGYTSRNKPFHTKTSLTCWAMANNREVLINDFEKEHALYIDKKEAYLFNSLLFIPFTLENDQPVALCAYSTRKNSFDQNDLVMFRILAQFIRLSIRSELKKQL